MLVEIWRADRSRRLLLALFACVLVSAVFVAWRAHRYGTKIDISFEEISEESYDLKHVLRVHERTVLGETWAIKHGHHMIAKGWVLEGGEVLLGGLPPLGMSPYRDEAIFVAKRSGDEKIRIYETSYPGRIDFWKLVSPTHDQPMVGATKEEQ